MLTQENCDPDEIINDFEKLFKTESNDETLKTYILGRKLNDDDTFKRSLYELVLSTAGQHKLVELITKRLKLNRNYEFLNAVS